MYKKTLFFCIWALIATSAKAQEQNINSNVQARDGGVIDSVSVTDISGKIVEELPIIS